VAAAVAGDAGGDADQVPSDGRAAGPGVERSGQGAGGAGQVVADGGAGRPCGVGREVPRGQAGERSVAEAGEDLLDDGVVAVRASAWIVWNGLSVKTGWQRQAGNSSPWPRGAWQLRSRTRRTISQAVTARPFLEASAVQGTSATCASEMSRPWSPSRTARGQVTGVQASSLIAAIAARTLRRAGTVTEKRAPPERIAPSNSVIAPCRSTSMSSMLSAPAAIPATRQDSLSPAFTPHGPPTLTCSPASAARPARPGP
jgi:hypothetical protein